MGVLWRILGGVWGLGAGRGGSLSRAWGYGMGWLRRADINLRVGDERNNGTRVPKGEGVPVQLSYWEGVLLDGVMVDTQQYDAFPNCLEASLGV